MRSGLRVYTRRFVTPYFKQMNTNYRQIVTMAPKLLYFLLTKRLSSGRLTTFLSKRPLQPSTKDSIYRIYALTRSWLVLTYRLFQGRGDPRSTIGDSGWVRSFHTAREMHGAYYGGFVKTRQCSPFRSRVDRKKLSKLHKDIAKAETMRLHRKRESARILAKAQAASGPKTKTKTGVAVKVQAKTALD